MTIKNAFFSLVLGLGLSGNALLTNAQQPNIVIFTADDMGMQMGALNTPGVKTPAIDQLVKEGVFFTKAYASFPSCSPSRTSFLTGTYPHENGVTTNVFEVLPELAATGTAKSPALNTQFAIKDNITTLIETLKKAGYYTGLTGKFHMSSPEKFPFDYWNRDTKADVFLKQAKASNKPFLLNFNAHSPHRPYAKSPNNRNIIDLNSLLVPAYLPNNALMQKDWSDYLGAVEYTDKTFSELWALLKKEGLDKNTLIIFISDHGPSIHRGKYYEYPFGSHIPVIFSGLNLPKNKKSSALFSLTDLMPTILEFLKIRVPASVTGKSALQSITGEKKSQTDYAFTEVAFPRKGETNYQGRGMTDGRYWYIRRNGNPRMVGKPEDNYEVLKWKNFSYKATLDGKNEFPEAYALMQVSENTPPSEELFDLSKDPWTQKDLSKSKAHQNIVLQMREVMNSHIIKTNDLEMMKTVIKK